MYCQPAYRTSTPPASKPMVAAVAPMPLHALSALFRSAPSSAITWFSDSSIFAYFGLPRALPQ